MTTKYVLTIYCSYDLTRYVFDSDTPRCDLEKQLTQDIKTGKFEYKEIRVDNHQVSELATDYDLQTMDEWIDEHRFPTSNVQSKTETQPSKA